MVLIILLMLSQDVAWSRQVHRVRLRGRQVSWFRERSLQGITLGEFWRPALGTPMQTLQPMQTLRCCRHLGRGSIAWSWGRIWVRGQHWMLGIPSCAMIFLPTERESFTCHRQEARKKVARARFCTPSLVLCVPSGTKSAKTGQEHHV